MTEFPLPRVLRARDFHLYLENGKRLTDLWLYGGRAVLGHKPPNTLREMKNAAERGLFTPLPHPAEKRFIKALEVFFPARTFRVYRDEASLRDALARAGFGGGGNPAAGNVSGDNLSCAGGRKNLAFPDPAFPAGSNPAGSGAPMAARERSVSLWRPFLEARERRASGPDSGSDGDGGFGAGSAVDGGGNGALTGAPVLIPVLPCPLGPAVLVLDKSAETSFPAGELVPPVLLAPATRALYDLAAAIKAAAPNRGRPRLPKIDRIFAGQKSGGQKPDNGLWRRRGIYLTVEPETDREKYSGLFRRFLEGGFLIPQSPCEPVILPASMSPGEESKLAKLLDERAG